MTQRTQFVAAVVLIAAVSGGVLFARPDSSGEVEQGMDDHDHAAMLAGMDEAQPVSLTEADARRIGVSFTSVTSKVLTPEVQALGVTTWDETRLHVVNPKVAGWVETLHVDFTGAPIREGAPLLDVYSPDLITAQEELVLAARLVREAGTDRGRENAEALFDAARRRLAYWGVAESEIAHAVDMGHVMRTVTLRAPASGVVVEKQVVEGDRIAPGDVLYRIADLSTVWVEVDVFERDLGSVRVGQAARVEFDAYPGEPVEARVGYIYPTVSLDSRTGRVRLEIRNPEGRLRPGMYARVRIGTSPTVPVLTVPQSAVLETGERSLVFMEAPDGRLVPRDVNLGRRIAREVVVLSGLREGDRVVSAAAFLVDAESNLGALGMEMEGMEMDSMEMDSMEMDSMEMGGTGGGDEMDHSGHNMDAMPDSGGGDEMDHSGHDMQPDTTGAREN